MNTIYIDECQSVNKEYLVLEGPLCCEGNSPKRLAQNANRSSFIESAFLSDPAVYQNLHNISPQPETNFRNAFNNVQ